MFWDDWSNASKILTENFGKIRKLIFVLAPLPISKGVINCYWEMHKFLIIGDDWCAWAVKIIKQTSLPFAGTGQFIATQPFKNSVKHCRCVVIPVSKTFGSQRELFERTLLFDPCRVLNEEQLLRRYSLFIGQFSMNLGNLIKSP